MAKASIAYINVQYEDYANWYLKAYEPFTTIAKEIYESDSNSADSFSKVQLDIEGFPVSSGGSRFIPVLNGRYDLWLFPTAKEADNNNTTNAIRMAKNKTAESVIDNVAEATYSSKGVVQLLDEDDVLEIFNEEVEVPEPFNLPDYSAIKKMIELQAPSGAAGTNIGDAVVTLNDLDPLLYVPQKELFDRTEFSELDALLGTYIPKTYDFSSASYVENQVDNNAVTISYGLYDNQIYVLKLGVLYLLNKDTLLIENTLNVGVDEQFIRAEVIHGKLVILAGITTPPRSLKIYTLTEDKTNFVAQMSIDDSYTSIDPDNYVLVEGNNGDFFICARNVYSLFNPPSDTSFYAMSLIKLEITFSENRALTYPILTQSMLEGDTSKQQIFGFFYDKINDFFNFLYKSSDSTKMPFIVKIPLSEINDDFNVFLNYTIPLSFYEYLSSPLSIYEDNFDSLIFTYTGSTSAACYYNEEENILKISSKTSSQRDVNNNTICRNVLFYIDLNNYEVKTIMNSLDFDSATNLQIDINSTGTEFFRGCSKDNNFVIDNIKYNVFSFRSGNTSDFGIIWVNIINKDVAFFYNHTEGGNNGGFYTPYDARVLIENNQDLYWMHGYGYQNNQAKIFRKLSLVDDVITNPKRPAPDLNTIFPMKGFIRAKL